MEFLRHRQHGFREERQPLHANRQFARMRPEKVAGDADVVAQIQQLVKRKSLLAHGVQPHINLQAHAVLLQRRKPRLTLCANRHNASGHSHGHPSGFKVLSRSLTPLGAHGRQGM
jgi:hypothetical protein